MADVGKFDEAYKDSAPGKKVRDMADETLEAFHQYFIDILPDLARTAGAVSLMPAAKGRIDILQSEIDRRHRTVQHRQTMRRAGWTLFWAAIGGIGTIGLLLVAIPLPKLFHAISSKWPQALETKPPSAMPSATQSPSAPPIASPKP